MPFQFDLVTVEINGKELHFPNSSLNDAMKSALDKAPNGNITGAATRKGAALSIVKEETIQGLIKSKQA